MNFFFRTLRLVWGLYFVLPYLHPWQRDSREVRHKVKPVWPCTHFQKLHIREVNTTVGQGHERNIWVDACTSTVERTRYERCFWGPTISLGTPVRMPNRTQNSTISTVTMHNIYTFTTALCVKNRSDFIDARKLFPSHAV